MMIRSVITGCGSYAPERVMRNTDFEGIVDTSDEWIIQRTGIEARHFARPDQATSDLAVPAARAALDDAGLGVDDIDYVVFATMTPDVYFPGAAPYFHRKIGMHDVPCLDIRQQCAGFLYGL